MIDIIALLAASTCGLIASFKTLQTVDKVNEKLPKNEQFDPLWWLGLFAATMPVMHMRGAHYTLGARRARGLHLHPLGGADCRVCDGASHVQPPEQFGYVSASGTISCLR
jgi:hypothetical protein